VGLTLVQLVPFILMIGYENQLTIYATNHVPNPRLCLDAIGSVHTFGIPL
jgi:hypothetical protein